MPLFRNHPVLRYSAFKTAATAAYFFEFSDESEIESLGEVLAEIRQKELPIVHIGAGTNCLFAFDTFPWCIVHHGIRGYTFSKEGERCLLSASSAELVSPLASIALREYGCKTLLPWVWLPGTVGGAVIGNAGCFWLETADILDSVVMFDTHTGKIATLDKDQMKYEYRNSAFKWLDRHVVISASFDLSPKQDQSPYTNCTIEEMQEIRRQKQPAGISCGSYFANPKDHSAGKLIDDAGLKGYSCGAMQISPKHGNFFINTGGATWQEVLQLAEHAKQEVFSRFWIHLHEEVRIIRAP